MLLSVAGQRHALTTSIQCSLNAKVKLINKPSSQAPKSKVAGVRWWDKLVNYSSSPVRDARDILHMCHCWHKKYIYAERMTRKFIGFVKLGIYPQQIMMLLLRVAWINYVWSAFNTLENIGDCSTSLQPKGRIASVPDEPQVVDTPGDTNLTTLLRDSTLNYTHQ